MRNTEKKIFTFLFGLVILFFAQRYPADLVEALGALTAETLVWTVILGAISYGIIRSSDRLKDQFFTIFTVLFLWAALFDFIAFFIGPDQAHSLDFILLVGGFLWAGKTVKDVWTYEK